MKIYQTNEAELQVKVKTLHKAELCTAKDNEKHISDNIFPTEEKCHRKPPRCSFEHHGYQIYCSEAAIPLMKTVGYRFVISNAADVPSKG